MVRRVFRISCVGEFEVFLGVGIGGCPSCLDPLEQKQCGKRGVAPPPSVITADIVEWIGYGVAVNVVVGHGGGRKLCASVLFGLLGVLYPYALSVRVPIGFWSESVRVAAVCILLRLRWSRKALPHVAKTPSVVSIVVSGCRLPEATVLEAAK